MDKLPPVSYLRMVDAWLISTQLLPFVEVVILTAIETNTTGQIRLPVICSLKLSSIETTINHHGFVRNVESGKNRSKDGGWTKDSDGRTVNDKLKILESVGMVVHENVSKTFNLIYLIVRKESYSLGIPDLDCCLLDLWMLHLFVMILNFAIEIK